RLVVAAFDVDVARVDVAALGQPQDCADLAAQLAGGGGAAGEQLLCPLGRLGQEVAMLLGLAVGALGGLEPEFPGGRLIGGLVGTRRLFALVAHRGPGASLNWTGTRPTP